jgi:hypothetical protein
MAGKINAEAVRAVIQRPILVFLAVAVLLMAAVRLTVAERTSHPNYRMDAGTTFIREEWNYCTRFDAPAAAGDPIGSVARFVNRKLFEASRPLFFIENRLLGRRIEAGDSNYRPYVTRVEKAMIRDWDYVVSSAPDGAGMFVVRDGSIIQKID